MPVAGLIVAITKNGSPNRKIGTINVGSVLSGVGRGEYETNDRDIGGRRIK